MCSKRRSEKSRVAGAFTEMRFIGIDYEAPEILS